MLSLNAPGTGEQVKKESAATVIKKIMKLFTEDPRDNFLIISSYRRLWLGVYLVHTVEKINFTSSLEVIIYFIRIPGEANDKK